MTNVNNGSWQSFYYPFGWRMDASGDDNKYTFTGKELDDESDLHYYWNRYYDSELGRFISVDPAWSKYPTLTSYQYCNNNPLKYVDPTGMEARGDSTELATIAASINNEIEGANITVEKKSETKVNLKQTLINFFTGNNTVAYNSLTYYALSTSNSQYDWGQNELASALYDCINSSEVIFNLKLADNYDGESLQGGFGGGYTDSYHHGADIYLDRRGNIDYGESVGIIALHEMVGHGHPVTSTMPPLQYKTKYGTTTLQRRPTGNATWLNVYYGSGYYDPGHAGYHKKIAWKNTGLYGR